MKRIFNLTLVGTFLFITLFGSLLSLSSCFKDSQQAQWNALGKHHIIYLYGCDGKEIKKWESTGNVSNQAHSDGYFFEDVTTGKLVEVSGVVVIEVK